MKKANKSAAFALIMAYQAIFLMLIIFGEPEKTEAKTPEVIQEEVREETEEKAEPEEQTEQVDEDPEEIIIESEDDVHISEKALVKYTEEIGEKYNICPELLQAMAERESSLMIKATNGTCKGLMQINETWHRERMERLGVTDIYDAYGSILTAADYINDLKEENSDIYYVLMRYNMNASTADRKYRECDYSDYAIQITKRAAELEKLHGKKG